MAAQQGAEPGDRGGQIFERAGQLGSGRRRYRLTASDRRLAIDKRPPAGFDARRSKARAAVNALMQDVALRAGVIGRLMLRRDDPTTWMEIYENVVDTVLFDAVLADATVRSGIAASAGEGRRIERFADAP